MAPGIGEGIKNSLKPIIAPLQSQINCFFWTWHSNDYVNIYFWWCPTVICEGIIFTGEVVCLSSGKS
jgi:hypothetical protein